MSKDKKETRVFKLSNELRANPEESGKKIVEGYASVFNSASEDLGGFIEYISPGAFKNAIPKSDIRALFNHDPNFILGRTTAGTLEVWEDEKGLKYRFEVPDTTIGRDFYESLKRGDINQSSFGFTVKKDVWEEINEGEKTTYKRTIEEVDRLFDVSPVTYPAYPSASVMAVRSLEAAQEKNIPVPKNFSASGRISATIRDGLLKIYSEKLF